MPDSCGVVGCTMRRDRDKIAMFRVPAIRKGVKSEKYLDVLVRRNRAWLQALGRNENTNNKNIKVCAKHFISGTPADTWNEIDPDWAPSQNIGLSKKKAKKPKVQQSESPVPDDSIQIEMLDQKMMSDSPSSIVQDQYKMTTFTSTKCEKFNICRLCLNDDMDYSVFIYAPLQYSNALTTVAQTIENLINIKVSESDGLPTIICSTCFETLQTLQNFQQKSIESYAKLQDMFGDKKHAHQFLEPIADSNADACPDSDFRAYDESGRKVSIEYIVCEQKHDIHSDAKQNADANPEFVDVNGIENKVSKTKDTKRASVDDKVKTINPKRNRNGKTLCTICGTLVWNQSLEQHANRHLAVKPYGCPENGCDKAFFTQRYLDIHYRGVHTYNEYECDMCGAIRSRKAALRTHMAYHFEGTRPCSICGRKFRFKRELVNHMMVHTNERPISCDVCSKKCRNKWQLHVHKRIHTKDRPYHCLYCGANFTYNYQLKTHTEKQHCSKPTSAASTLFNSEESL